MQVLAGKGPKLVLDLPAGCFKPTLEPSISAIMRHILEDPATLQAAMEAEIRATLSKQKTPPNRTGASPCSLRSSSRVVYPPACLGSPMFCTVMCPL